MGGGTPVDGFPRLLVDPAKVTSVDPGTHKVTFTEGGVFHRLMGAQEVMTNTLHGQGIMRPADRIVIDGHAPDGTPEAIYVKDAPGFTLAVQWHPEMMRQPDPCIAWIVERAAAFAEFERALRAKLDDQSL